MEREVKLRAPDAAAARDAVEAMGARLRRARHLEDNLLLDEPSRRLAAAGTALRLRRAEGRGVLTFKGPRQADPSGMKARVEIEFEVSDAATAETFLRALGYEPAFRYQKFREVWDWKDAEIVVDETPVGTFIEVEGPAVTI
jgi:adenylate cyclase class 2